MFLKYCVIVHHCSVNVRWESAFAVDYPVGLQNQLIDHNNNMGWIHFLQKQSLFSYLFQMNINIRNKVCFCDWRMFRIVTRLEKLLSRNPLLTNCITYGSLSGNFSGFHLKYTSPGTKPVSVNSYYTRTGPIYSSQPRTKKLFFNM